MGSWHGAADNERGIFSHCTPPPAPLFFFTEHMGGGDFRLRLMGQVGGGGTAGFRKSELPQGAPPVVFKKTPLYADRPSKDLLNGEKNRHAVFSEAQGGHSTFWEKRKP